MSDTDVYRLVRLFKEPDEWHVMYSSMGCTSGFYSSLPAIKGVRTRRQREDKRHGWVNEYKIQHLESTPVFLEEDGSYALEWVDVDA